MSSGAYLGGEALGHGPPFGSPGLQNCIEKWAKLRHGAPFVSWASGFGLEITWYWAKNGTKFEWRPFFFALHLILGEKWDEIWAWQFQILIYVPLKFSKVSAHPPFSKSCIRYWVSWHKNCRKRLLSPFSSMVINLGQWPKKCDCKHKGPKQNFLRKFVGVAVFNKVRSYIEPWLLRIERSLLRWFCHVSRMPQERLSIQALPTKASEKRSGGRHRAKWTNCIKDLRWDHLGLYSSKKKEVMEDREVWRLSLKLLPPKPSRKSGQWRESEIIWPVAKYFNLICSHTFVRNSKIESG